MKRKKEDYFVIALGLILVVIILILAVVTTNDVGSPEPVIEPTIAPSPTTMSTNSKPPLFYSRAGQDKLLEYIRNRQPLTENDRLAKAKILAILPQSSSSGVVYRTNNIIIDYTQSADIFQVEILTTDIQRAKNEATLWLTTQGLSQEAICTLPVGFYMNSDVASELRKTNLVFYPLGDGC